jgi:transposase
MINKPNNPDSYKSKTKTKPARRSPKTGLTAPQAPSAERRLAPPLPNPMTAAEFLAECERRGPAQRALAQAEAETGVLVDSILEVPALATPSVPANSGGALKPHRVVKLGIDVHLDRYVVVRQVDGAAPQPPQRFSPAEFLKWAQKQSDLALRVYTCYEAGPFGYSLHRQLMALGLTNYVVRPRDWDEYGKQVKTDKRDAQQLVLHLDRYVGGNTEAFCVVRVPSEPEEQARSRSRQRESLQKEKQRLAAQGRGHALYYGAHLEGSWWLAGPWQKLVLPPIVLELLEPLRRLIQALEQELQAATKAITAQAAPGLPLGLGALSAEILEREIGDWHRFQNRRQVASYTGMCPREDTSDQRRFQGSINKHGNPRVRTVLVETAWRLIQFQPEYKPVVKWRKVLADPKATRSKRKQMAVAIGRQFSVDWWRVRTHRIQAQAVGLKLKPTPTAAASGASAADATKKP